MTERRRRWARLLPDHRTMYLSLEELDVHREPGESDASLLMRSLSFAERVNDEDGQARLLALDLARRAGLPERDPLGFELAMAIVVRSRFLREHPQVEQALAAWSE